MTRLISVRFFSIPVLLALWLSLQAAATLAQPSAALVLNLLTIAIALSIAAFLFPGAALLAGVAVVVFSPENFQEFQWIADAVLPGFSARILLQLFTLLTMVPALARYRFRNEFNGGLAAVIAIFLISALLATRFPGLTEARMISAAIGLALPFLYFSIKIPRRWSGRHLFVISILPLVSLAFGYAAELVPLHDIIGGRWLVLSHDAAGALRLRGMNVPAYLAFFCYISLFISFYMAALQKKRGYYLVMALTLIVMALTGARTPMICGLLMMAAGALLASPADIRNSTKVLLLGAGAVFAGVLLVMFWPDLTARFTAYSEASRGILAQAGTLAHRVNPFFGRGIGAGDIVLLGDQAALTGGVSAAPNEYSRLLVDMGVFGLVVYVIGAGHLIVSECRGLSRSHVRYIAAMAVTVALYSIGESTVSAPPALALIYSILLVIAHAKRMSALRAHARALRR